jgi:hypothetical protein
VSFIKGVGASQIHYLAEKSTKSLFQLQDSSDFDFAGFTGSC